MYEEAAPGLSLVDSMFIYSIPGVKYPWYSWCKVIICLASSASLGNSTNPESLTTFESTNKAPDE